MAFSKRILIASWVVALFLTLLSVVLPIYCVSVEGLLVALPLSWGELTAANGFYLWKAKNENRHKYAMRYVDKIASDHDIETALRVAEIVLRD